MTDNVKISIIAGIVSIVTAAITSFGSINLKKGEVAEATGQLQGASAEARKLRASVSASVIPVGIVGAFNLAGSPDGWVEFEKGYGRTIVGVGQGANLSPRTLLEIGGIEKYALSIDEIPSHKHATSEAGDSVNSKHGVEQGQGKHGVSWADTTVSNTAATGGSQAHANMQPFVALRLCTKQ